MRGHILLLGESLKTVPLNKTETMQYKQLIQLENILLESKIKYSRYNDLKPKNNT